MSYSTAAQAYLARKDLPRAIDSCHRAKNLLPRAPEPHRYLARAYLLEGQTENAVVEYKSLWHALLTAERPKAALETLKGILESDCKYTNVRDQVLSHAQNSEAIKTSKATRYLVYVLIVIIIAGGGIAGWQWYQQNIVKGKGDLALQELKTSVQPREITLQHQDIIRDIDDLNTTYGSRIQEIHNQLEQLRENVKTDFNNRAMLVLSKAESLKSEGRFADAQAVLLELKQRYSTTDAASQADALLEIVRTDQLSAEVAEKDHLAQSLWNNLQWTEALAMLDSVLKRPDLPPRLQNQIETERSGWLQDSRNGPKLFLRAQHIEANGSKDDALAAYRLAAQGEGQVDQARARVLALELDMAHALGHDAQNAAQHGDDALTFTSLDKLQLLAKQAASHEVSDFLTSLELPSNLALAVARDLLLVKSSLGGQTRLAGPSGLRGPWTRQIIYHVGEVLTIEVSRQGFSSQTLTVQASNHRTRSVVELVRGAHWRIDLSGMPTTRPVPAGPLVMVGTDKASIEVVDPATGANRPWHLPSAIPSLTEFLIPPVLFQDHIYAVLAEHLFLIDVNSRQTTFFPDNPAQGSRYSGPIALQEHEIIAGSFLAVLPVVKSGAQLLEIDPQGRITEYPRLDDQVDVTGGPLIDHPGGGRTVLYLPTSNGLNAYEITGGVQGHSADQALLGPIQGRSDRHSGAGAHARPQGAAGGRPHRQRHGHRCRPREQWPAAAQLAAERHRTDAGDQPACWRGLCRRHRRSPVRLRPQPQRAVALAVPAAGPALPGHAGRSACHRQEWDLLRRCPWPPALPGCAQRHRAVALRTWQSGRRRSHRPGWTDPGRAQDRQAGVLRRVRAVGSATLAEPWFPPRGGLWVVARQPCKRLWRGRFHAVQECNGPGSPAYVLDRERAMRRCAFTLVELLIVIAVIMILLGLLFPIISIIKTQAYRAKALQQITTIAAACEHYKALDGAYPDNSLTIQKVFQPQGTGTTPVNWSPTLDWTTVGLQLVSCLRTVDNEDFLASTPLGSLLDPWKTVYRYRPLQYYPYATTGTIPPIDGTTPPHADSVQLWSCGPDLRDDAMQLGATVGTPTSPLAGDDIFIK